MVLFRRKQQAYFELELSHLEENNGKILVKVDLSHWKKILNLFIFKTGVLLFLLL